MIGFAQAPDPNPGAPLGYDRLLRHRVRDGRAGGAEHDVPDPPVALGLQLGAAWDLHKVICSRTNGLEHKPTLPDAPGGYDILVEFQLPADGSQCFHRDTIMLSHRKEQGDQRVHFLSGKTPLPTGGVIINAKDSSLT